MAILHVDAAKRPTLRWVLAAGVAAALGSALHFCAAFEQEPTNRTETASGGARSAARPSATAIPPVALAPGPLARESARAERGGADLYRQALTYLDCQTLGEYDATAGRGASDQSFQFDPSGALTTIIEGEARARREPCRLLGPYEYRQIDSLMRRAAQKGDADARFFLLNRHVRSALERAADAQATGQPIEPRELTEALNDLLAMAAHGHRDAMTLASQLISAGHTGAPDPVRAAAWNLVALQLDLTKPLSPVEIGNSGVLSSLSAEEAVEALHDAEVLRSTCCQQR